MMKNTDSISYYTTTENIMFKVTNDDDDVLFTGTYEECLDYRDDLYPHEDSTLEISESK